MDMLRFDQGLTLALFMLALGGLWLFVHRHKQGLSARLHRVRRLQIGENLSLGAHTRIALIAVDGREFLLITGKTGTPALHPIAATLSNDAGQP
jgi:flagellar protein FliO/FliZ